MSEYLRSHVGVTQFLSVWACTPLTLTLVHFMTKPSLPWHECIRLIFPMLAFCSVVFFLLGLMVDKINRDHLNRDFLAKLESDIPSDSEAFVKRFHPHARAKRINW